MNRRLQVIRNSFSFLLCISYSLHANSDVLTAGYSNARTGATLQETVLSPSNVSPSTFGKIRQFPVDGQIYAQPLYAGGLDLPGRGASNVVFVATMHNSVYAINARDPSAVPLWQVNLGASVPSYVINCDDVYPEVGILGTPVIDRAAGVIYVVSESLENAAPLFKLHALSLLDGSETLNGPVRVTASVAGNAVDNAGGKVVFDPWQQLQRPGLLLANGAVYLAFGSHGDSDPWHGWLLGYDASDLGRQIGVFNSTPNGDGGAIWQAGRGIAEGGGMLYAGTANGDYDGQSNLGNSFLKFSPALKPLDWYTPNDWQTLSDDDNDVASAGPALIPGTDLLVGGDKAGTLYLLHRRGMANLAQTFTPALGSPILNYALWPVPGNPLLYVQTQGDYLHAYSLATGQFDGQPTATSIVPIDLPYQGIAVSSNGSKGGIVWMTTGDHSAPSVPGTLHAFDALTLSELWNSDAVPGRDDLGGFAKFATPTIADGQVFVPTFSYQLAIYGLLEAPSGQPTLWGAVNAASFVGDAVSPGEAVILSGANLLPQDGGVQVLFDGVATPAQYYFSGQIGVLVPTDVSGPLTNIQVVGDGNASNTLTLPVLPATPGVYTADGSGAGQALAFNEDGSANSDDNPASWGSQLLLVVNGAANGLPAANMSVLIGGVPADVLYAGPADSGAAGAVAVLVLVPDTIPVSDAAVVVTIGRYSSQAGVTVAVD